MTLIRCKARGLIKAVISKNYWPQGNDPWMVYYIKTVSTKMGEAMEFVTFEDETGLIETVFFPDIYRKSASILEHHSAFLVSGRVAEEFGVAILEVADFKSPPEASISGSESVSVSNVIFGISTGLRGGIFSAGDRLLFYFYETAF